MPKFLQDVVRYEDFPLAFTKGADPAVYQLRATGVPELPPATFKIPFSARDVEKALSSISRSSQTWISNVADRESLDPLKELGARLFTSIFTGALAERYQQFAARADDEGKGVRLRLLMDDSDLAGLPWEFLYDIFRQDFAALSLRSPVVRRRLSASAEPTQTLAPLESTLRVLFISADPSDGDGANEEMRRLKKLSGTALTLEIDLVANATAARLREAMQARPYHILHYIGARSWPQESTERSGVVPTSDPDQPALALLSEGGSNGGPRQSQPLDRSTVRGLLRSQPELRLVFLNSDNTGQLANAWAAAVPAVIGWRGVNSSDGYNAFVESVYSTLLAGQPLEAAVTQGRQRIDYDQPGGREWGMPMFYLQTADGTITKRPQNVDSSSYSVDASQNPRVQSLNLQLNIQQQNLRTLKTQQAVFQSSSSVPAQSLQAQIMEVEDKIAKLTQELRAHEG